LPLEKRQIYQSFGGHIVDIFCCASVKHEDIDVLLPVELQRSTDTFIKGIAAVLLVFCVVHEMKDICVDTFIGERFGFCH